MTKNPPVVVITGASSGIGRATALRFAQQGAFLVLASRRAPVLRELAAECESLGGTAIAVATDVTNPLAMAALAEEAVANYGRIDVWVNNAAVSVFSAFTTVPLDDFRRVIDVNIMGYVYGARAALEVMTQQGSGVLVNVASIVGEVPQPYTSAYGMSKAAIRSLGVSLRQELALQKVKGVKVVTVSPPTVDTPFFRHAANYTGRTVLAMPPVYSPELVAKVIVAASRRPRTEVLIGAAGKALVRQHRKHPNSVEAQMAMQVDRTHLSRKDRAGETSGNLFAPAPTYEANVVGGWRENPRTARRTWLTALALAGGGAVLVRSAGARRLLTTAGASALLNKLPAVKTVVAASALAKMLPIMQESGGKSRRAKSRGAHSPKTPVAGWQARMKKRRQASKGSRLLRAA